MDEKNHQITHRRIVAGREILRNHGQITIRQPQAVSTLACEGKLLLNPLAVGIPEDRYGDGIEGAYQISRVTASDLKLMTTPYSAPAVNDESKLSADEYWAAHPELAANNKALMLGYLQSHELPLTAESLFEAFRALKR